MNLVLVLNYGVLQSLNTCIETLPVHPVAYCFREYTLSYGVKAERETFKPKASNRNPKPQILNLNPVPAMCERGTQNLNPKMLVLTLM